MAVDHANRCGLAVHHPGKPLDRPAEAFGHDDGDIIGGFDQQNLDGGVQCQGLADLHADLGRRHGLGPLGGDQRRGPFDPARLHRFERQIDRHQFGDRSRVPQLRRVIAVNHAARIEIGQQQGGGAQGQSRQAQTNPDHDH